MDEFRLGLLNQMGQNRSRVRRHRAPWFFGLACTPVAVALAWFLGVLLLPAGILVAGWGMTLHRVSRNNGRELHRLLGQALVLAGIAVAAGGAWSRFG
jgi:hypothetical protein